MKPNFDKENNSTSCLCFNQTNYPTNICSNVLNLIPSDSFSLSNKMKETELWQRQVTPIEKVIAITQSPSKTKYPLADSQNLRVWWQNFMDFLQDSRNEMWTLLAILIFGLAIGFSISIICLKQMRRRRRKDRARLGNPMQIPFNNQLCRIGNLNELEPLGNLTDSSNVVITETIVDR